MSYKRLTERDKDGIAIYEQKCNADTVGENLYIQAQREEAVLNRLAELEDKIERGELVENTTITYVNMARSGGKTLIDKALKFDELYTKIASGTLIEFPRIDRYVDVFYGVKKYLVQWVVNGKVKSRTFWSKKKAEKKLKELQNER